MNHIQWLVLRPARNSAVARSYVPPAFWAATNLWISHGSSVVIVGYSAGLPAAGNLGSAYAAYPPGHVGVHGRFRCGPSLSLLLQYLSVEGVGTAQFVRLPDKSCGLLVGASVMSPQVAAIGQRAAWQPRHGRSACGRSRRPAAYECGSSAFRALHAKRSLSGLRFDLACLLHRFWLTASRGCEGPLSDS